MKEKIGIQDIKDVNKFESRYDEKKWLSEAVTELLKEIPTLDTDDIISRYCAIKTALSNTPVLRDSDSCSFNSPEDADELSNVLSAYKEELEKRRVPLPNCIQ